MTAPDSGFRLVEPCLALLPAYAEALARGWSPNTVRDVSAEQLAAIHTDAAAFIDELLSQVGSITFPDGRTVPKLPHRTRWMSDGGFVGHIGLRWQPNTDALPDHVLGHIGYAVVPWKRGRGYATRALGLMLGEAREVGLPRLRITCDSRNAASRRVIEANGGKLAGTFVNPDFGPELRLLYIIDLPL
jgi:predicted acetyltransferase